MTRATRRRVNLDALDRERFLRGWSKADLAERMGSCADTVSDIYRLGAATPAQFRRMASAFAEAEPLAGAEGLLDADGKGAAA